MTRGTPRETTSGRTHARKSGSARARAGEGGAATRKAAKPLSPSVVFGPATFAFLRELDRNNDREWFDSNKDRYEAHVRAPALHLIGAMTGELAKVTKHLVADPRPVGGSLMRIHRDVRFSPDKRPYKTNIGIQFRHAAGKDVRAPGLYLHVSPKECFLGIGLWHPEAPALAAIRRRIVERPSEWAKVRGATAFKNAWALAGESLARPPKGFDPEHPHLVDLKRKDHIAVANLAPAELADPDLAKKIGKRLAAASDYVKFMCTALELPF
jgi:uncharacterized protein (TIGR02453 family)